MVVRISRNCEAMWLIKLILSPYGGAFWLVWVAKISNLNIIFGLFLLLGIPETEWFIFAQNIFPTNFAISDRMEALTPPGVFSVSWTARAKLWNRLTRNCWENNGNDFSQKSKFLHQDHRWDTPGVSLRRPGSQWINWTSDLRAKMLPRCFFFQGGMLHRSVVQWARWPGEAWYHHLPGFWKHMTRKTYLVSNSLWCNTVRLLASLGRQNFGPMYVSWFLAFLKTE